MLILVVRFLDEMVGRLFVLKWCWVVFRSCCCMVDGFCGCFVCLLIMFVLLYGVMYVFFMDMEIEMDVVIVGGGFVGFMLGFLLVCCGFDVMVIEKYVDFLWDFCGDMIYFLM